ncbi:hypothetical protein ACFL0V_06370 [Nanoarchaeota archaeon]
MKLIHILALAITAMFSCEKPTVKQLYQTNINGDNVTLHQRSKPIGCNSDGYVNGDSKYYLIIKKPDGRKFTCWSRTGPIYRAVTVETAGGQKYMVFGKGQDGPMTPEAGCLEYFRTTINRMDRDKISTP